MDRWSRDQPQPRSLFQRPREAEKRDPGNEVAVTREWAFLLCVKREWGYIYSVIRESLFYIFSILGKLVFDFFVIREICINLSVICEPTTF